MRMASFVQSSASKGPTWIVCLGLQMKAFGWYVVKEERLFLLALCCRCL